MGHLKSFLRCFFLPKLVLLSGLMAHAQVTTVVNLLGDEVQQQDLRIYETVPEIKVENLGKFHGHYLKMYYVVGLAPLLDRPENIFIREIKRIDLIKIEEREHLLPSVRIPKEGISTSYNYLILMISKSSRALLTNPDGSLAPGQASQSNGMIDPEAVRFVVSRQQILKPSIDAGIWEWGKPEPEKFIPFVFQVP